MPRSALAYLSDIVDACQAIGRFLSDVDYPSYREAELVRSGVERQLILIGEAMGALRRLDPSLAARIEHAGRIIGFRNLLAHDYPSVNHAVVWVIATDEVPALLAQCRALLVEVGGRDESDGSGRSDKGDGAL